MADASPDKAEFARRFAAECDAIALRGAAPDCAEQLEALHARFDAECARRIEAEFSTVADPAREAEAARR